MQTLEYLAILRRRWVYVALGTLVGLVAGWVTAPGSADRAEAYSATTTLLVNANSSNGPSLNLEQSALIVENGAVPQQVSQRLADKGLAPYRSLTAAADNNLRSLAITALSSTRDGAAAAANLAAEELNASLNGAVQSQQQLDLAQARTSAADLVDKVNALDQQLAGLDPDDSNRTVLEDQRQGLSASLAEAQRQVQQLESAAPQVPPLTVLEAASGKPYHAEGFEVPTSKPARALVLGMFGFLLGIVGAIASERLDKRIRNKDDAEQAFDLPVIAEIPPLPSGAKGRELLAATRPAAPFVEAHRALRTVVLFASEEEDAARLRAAADRVNGNGSQVDLAQVILVTSPAAGEGKTTTVAHLAAVLAEFGKRVLVISADFRRPRLHELFEVPREPGLADVLESAGGDVPLSDLHMATSYERVHLLPSGSPVDNPAQLLTETRQLIAAARQLFDFVVIDTPPLLVANDATELTAIADMVILMAKADHTSREAARRSVEILSRVEAPMLGIVLCAAHDTPTAYGYYRNRYYADTDQGGGRRARKQREAALAAATAWGAGA